MRAHLILMAAALNTAASLATAQTSYSGHGAGMDHAAHGQSSQGAAPVLSEPGQGAFAALSEVVRVLEADPATDWSKVDLTGLRAHLVDMDRLVSDSVVAEEKLPDGIVATVTGDAETIPTLHRIVPAHAAQLARDDRWTVSALTTPDGIELRVASDDARVIARISGLGFFGLMASQDHHREHHLLMALGKDAHGH